jgi:hypothetical protein
MKGKANGGTDDHHWAILDEKLKMTICKHLFVRTPSWMEKGCNDDWMVVTEGTLNIHKPTSTIEIIP